MSIKLEIIPSSSSLDLLGPPDASSAYSLSGYISLSLTSPCSLFERRRAVRILLRSLVITFEGQAELVTHEAGYDAVRLCAISKELVSNTTVELSNEGLEDGEEPCTWHVMFNLTIPGWLPASDRYGDCRQGFSGTQYNLYATMKFANVDESFGPSWVAALCTPFLPRNKVVHAERCGITLHRFALPPRSSSSVSESAPLCNNMRYFSITPNAAALCPEDNPHSIPPDLVARMELMASVPEYIDVDDSEEKFSLTLSLRTSSLSESQAAKLRVSQLSFDLQQVDQYSSSAGAYAARHSLPSQKNQPPHKPLRDAHPVHILYDVGLMASPLPFIIEDAHSLLPGGKRVDIQLDSGDQAHKCAEGLHPAKWFTMKTQVPFVRCLSPRKDEALEWTGTPRVRESAEGPFFTVAHSLRIVVALSYHDDGDGERDGAAAADGNDGKPKPSTSYLAFTIPLQFARFRGRERRSCSPHLLSCSPGFAESESDASGLPAAVSPSSQPYYVPDLPAYSQLFYPNGDLRHDDSTPLPLYTPSPKPLLT